MHEEALTLSIIIPVYNSYPYLRECLDSCLDSDADPDLYEIICIDDGSPDASGAVLDEYAAKYPNVKVIHKENGGVSTARNAGMRIAVGEYYWFVDPDDFIQDGIIPKLFQTIIKEDHPDMITFGVYEFGDYSDCPELSKEELEHKLELKNNRAPNEEYDATLCRHFYKSRIFRENKIEFDPLIVACEDNVVHFLFEGQIKTEAMLPDVGYFYRLRGNGLTHQSAERCYESRVRIAALFVDYYKEMYGNHYIAGYMLTSQLKMALRHITKMKNPRRKTELTRLKTLGLFPLTIDKKDTFFEIKRDESKALNRLYNKAYNEIYTISGYRIMRVFALLDKVKELFK